MEFEQVDSLDQAQVGLSLGRELCLQERDLLVLVPERLFFSLAVRALGDAVLGFSALFGWRRWWLVR